jgi:rod shape determining protein RodA
MGMQGLFGEAVDRIGGEPISARMARKAPVRHLDPSLLLVTLLLSAFGTVMVSSATAAGRSLYSANPYFQHEVIYLIVGAVALLGVALFDYRHLRGLSPVVYGATILALLVVLTPLGTLQLGARRWIGFGVFQVQPSELAKLVAIVAAAAYLAARKGDIRAIDVGIVLAIVAIPMALIYLEPDLGTTMVFLAVTAALLLVGGAKIRHFIALGLLGGIGILFVLQLGILHQYQIDRLTAFLHPNPDVQSVGYNLTQSKIAIGSGGIRGKGLEKKNTQTALDFVPSQQTDFIFTAVGEQLGFVGGAVLLALFGFLIWRALRVAAMARDLFGTLIATGIAALWAFQLFVNVGMTMGIMPITGIPLPFISYGGSSLVTNYAAVGLLLNIHMRRFLSP